MQFNMKHILELIAPSDCQSGLDTLNVCRLIPFGMCSVDLLVPDRAAFPLLIKKTQFTYKYINIMYNIININKI